MSRYDGPWAVHLAAIGIPPTSTFSLVRGGSWLCDLPPALTLPDAVGLADPYTWERAPGSANWRPYGDGVQPKRPQLQLSGTWTYDSDLDALSDIARIEELLPLADALHWCGLRLVGLLPGSVTTPTLGATAREVKHMLQLNLSITLTAAMLRDARLRGNP